MKVLYLKFVLLFFAWSMLTNLHAQENMYITMQDGTVLEFPINEIEALTFDVSTNLMLQKEILSKFLEVKTYPNPASDHVYINYMLADNGKVILEIFNSDGRIITGFSPGWLPSGEYNYRWETSNIPPGMYILRILQNNSLVTDKIIINR